MTAGEAGDDAHVGHPLAGLAEGAADEVPAVLAQGARDLSEEELLEGRSTGPRVWARAGAGRPRGSERLREELERDMSRPRVDLAEVRGRPGEGPPDPALVPGHAPVGRATFSDRAPSVTGWFWVT
ncbi:MAG: hypothetical protein LBT40_07410 [Deltaproteobacteria bacterium]|nr:hypothetical protein [Deltaproteobacteria bacterium]